MMCENMSIIMHEYVTNTLNKILIVNYEANIPVNGLIKMLNGFLTVRQSVNC